ncbi:MAG: hypothetical protein KC451_14000 [Amylibacter sp.]|jgi:hypothetical protein|nr:hypothetical protein [Amylibacter sp.]
MQKTLFALSLGFGCIIFALQAAQAQQQANCGQRGQVIERLQTKYGESRRSVGLAANNGVVETYASTESGTWTIVITMPNGMTCLVAAGEAFQPVDEAAVTRGDKV